MVSACVSLRFPQEKHHPKSLVHVLPNLISQKKKNLAADNDDDDDVDAVGSGVATGQNTQTCDSDAAFKAALAAAEKEVQGESIKKEDIHKPRKRQAEVQAKIDAAPRSLEELLTRAKSKARIHHFDGFQQNLLNYLNLPTGETARVDLLLVQPL